MTFVVSLEASHAGAFLRAPLLLCPLRCPPVQVRRYIFSARVMDESGELTLQVFNEQAEQLLGIKADELAEIRESGGWIRED